MGQIILCETKETKNPYEFSSFQRKISTYEELCYYIREHFLIFVEEGISEELFQWMVQELEISELEQEWSKITSPKERLRKVISCRNYFLPQEISVLMKKYDRYKRMSDGERKIRLGDEYLKQKRYAKALKYYHSAKLEEMDGRTCYNMAVCYVCQWDFERAAALFLKSYQLSKKKKALDAYYTVLMFQGECAAVKIMAGNEYSAYIQKWKIWKEEWKRHQQETQAVENNHYKKQRLKQWKTNYRREME
ncbi:MAG: hypothetical protein UHS41_09070 [Lachnospiraceae bacterium]|nr:hypothetical protein [Lachnospiraceae bacterium]